MHTDAVQLTATQPYDFARSLAFLSAFSPMAGEQHVGEGAIWKAVQLDGVTVGVRLRAAPGGVDCRLWSAGPISPSLRARAAAWARSFLSLDDDLGAFYSRAAEDEVVAPYVKKLHGLHQVRLTTPFEGAVWAVLGQRCPQRVARAMKDRLVAAYGGHITVEGRELPAFPEAASLVGVSVEALAGVIGHEQKARRVHAVVAAFAGVDEDFLRTAPVEEVRDWLLHIDGIGPWSAAFILLRAVGRTESVAGAEAQLADAIGAAYGKTLSAHQFRVLAADWEGLQGYWSFYLKAGTAIEARAAVPR